MEMKIVDVSFDPSFVSQRLDRSVHVQSCLFWSVPTGKLILG